MRQALKLGESYCSSPRVNRRSSTAFRRIVNMKLTRWRVYNSACARRCVGKEYNAMKLATGFRPHQ